MPVLSLALHSGPAFIRGSSYREIGTLSGRIQQPTASATAISHQPSLDIQVVSALRASIDRLPTFDVRSRYECRRSKVERRSLKENLDVERWLSAVGCRNKIKPGSTTPGLLGSGVTVGPATTALRAPLRRVNEAPQRKLLGSRAAGHHRDSSGTSDGSLPPSTRRSSPCRRYHASASRPPSRLRRRRHTDHRILRLSRAGGDSVLR